VQEGRDDLQALDGTLLLLALGRADLVLELDTLFLEVDLLQEVAANYKGALLALGD